jgi:hypothetical protein
MTELMSSARLAVSRPARFANRRLAAALRLLGAGGLIAEGGVHVQQYAQIVHFVPRVGPLFVLNAVGCAVTAAGLSTRRTARLAAAVGVVISLASLAALAKSFDGGFLGWAEGTLRPAIWIAIVSETVSAVALGALLVSARSPDEGRTTATSPGRALGAADPGLAR